MKHVQMILKALALLVRSPGAIRRILVEDSQDFLREGGSVQNCDLISVKMF
jgi:hypothetical protein